MRFFVDTADIAAIRELHELGMVDGVTTNPSLILKSGSPAAARNAACPIASRTARCTTTSPTGCA